MIGSLLLLVVGAAVLVKSADWMVEIAARLAHRVGMSDLVIGLTLTSIGTSVPELAASLSATAQGNPAMALGNVMGSDIANIGLILGVSALVKPIDTDPKMHERDGFVMFAAALAVFGLALDNVIGRGDGMILLLAYAGYLAFLARTDRGEADHRFRAYVDYLVDLGQARGAWTWVRGRFRPVEHPPSNTTAPPADDTAEPPKPSDAPGGPQRRLAWDIAAVLAAAAGVAVGAHLFTGQATLLAAWAGIPPTIVGLSLVAIGTSLPELTVAVAAARKGRADMVVGNVMGSNVANTLGILGLCALATPVPVSELSVVYTLPIVTFFSLGLLYLVRSGWRITRAQGGMALLAYVTFLVLAFVQGWS